MIMANHFSLYSPKMFYVKIHFNFLMKYVKFGGNF